ncbi:hypothetical protein [Halothermothrix orenii]|nr:hypothetical protein [Halothermothrix orenii]
MKRISANTIIFVLLALVFVFQRSWTPAIITGVATAISFVVDVLREE